MQIKLQKEKPMKFEDCICFQLGRLSRKITKHYREKISALNLTHPQFFMLIAAIEMEGALPSQLSEKTATDRATTTGLIDRLVRDGWLERKAVSGDRRSLSIHLSEKTKKHKNKLISIFEEINGQFLNRFSPVEWEQLQHLLNKLE